jgi:predicted naringenin-chalcone synthase
MPDFRMPLRKEIHHFDKFPDIHPGGRKLLDEVASQLHYVASSKSRSSGSGLMRDLSMAHRI